MKSVYIIGAGALGLRHLEGLLAIAESLAITVIDPAIDALNSARAAVGNNATHTVMFAPATPAGTVDLAIIATTSLHRAEAVRNLLTKADVANIILEKILFTKKEDYETIGNLLKTRGVRAWVNCPLRLMPVRREMKDHINGSVFSMHIGGGERYGLMTNIMHYTDYATYLAGANDFTVDTSMLSPQVIESKRAGYIELVGTIALRFANGSSMLCTTLPHPRARRTVIASESVRAVFEESESVARISTPDHQWAWRDTPAPLSYQSDMTGPLVDEVLVSGTCALPTFEQSAVQHLAVLNPVAAFLAASGIHTEDQFPFT